MSEILQVLLHLEQTDRIKKLMAGPEDGDPTTPKKTYYQLVK
jgi:hypothetical protein